MRLADKIRSDLVLIAPAVERRDELFRLFGSVFERSGLVPDGDQVVHKLLEREQILSTGIGGGVAVPHAQVPGIGQLAMAASIHPAGIDYPALDEKPVRLVFCLIGGSRTAADHLAGLARLARLARRGDALDRLIGVDTGDAFLAVLSELEGA